jgi:hypothetical protein
LPPRFVGRDEMGRIWPLADVLACELHTMHWMDRPLDEGTNLILWRGPYIFETDNDCDWREPFHIEREASGRRVALQEHCRHRAGGSDRTVVLDVSNDYRITMR